MTLSTTTEPVEDLTYLLHKHPGRAHTRKLSVGATSVFCTELSDVRCTVALLLEVDPIGLLRGQGAALESFTLGQYVNDRPYVASSLLTGAVRGVYGTALAGTCDARPERVNVPLDLEVHLPTVACADGQQLIERLFAPLGWRVEAGALPLDPEVPEWGDANIFDVRLTGTAVLQHALQHLTVLLPVLDNAKHYWADQTEPEKLLRHGGGWLGDHPERELILRRFLRHQRDLIEATEEAAREAAKGAAEEAAKGAGEEAPGRAEAGARTGPGPAAGSGLGSDSETGPGSDPGSGPGSGPAPAPAVRAPSLATQRRDAVHAQLTKLGAASVLDMGCGQGALLAPLARDPRITRLVGADVSARALDQAARRLGLESAPDALRNKVGLIQASLTYRDDRLAGFDAIVLMEVIEHLDLERLPVAERTVFADARPKHVLVTTPNVEYNAAYPGLAAGELRNHDHRFEWTRAEFSAWAERVASAHGYSVEFAGIGPEDTALGAATQLAVFSREAGAGAGGEARSTAMPQGGAA
ncbi:hypothetical protein GCM10020360_25520 [Nonlabens tegetincola]